MNKRRPKKDTHVTCDRAARLKKLLRMEGRTIAYCENIPDKEFPGITCSVYGVPKSNELFVKLSNGKTAFVEVIQSDVAYPKMKDRIFGMDVSDHRAAFSLADRMWEKHRDSLVNGTYK